MAVVLVVVAVVAVVALVAAVVFSTQIQLRIWTNWVLNFEYSS